MNFSLNKKIIFVFTENILLGECVLEIVPCYSVVTECFEYFNMHLSFISLGSFPYVFGFPCVSLTTDISGILFLFCIALFCFVCLPGLLYMVLLSSRITHPYNRTRVPLLMGIQTVN